jgi:hypothetical protein
MCHIIRFPQFGWFCRYVPQVAAFDRAGLADRLVLLAPGEAAELAD